MDSKYLEEIKAREQAATKGPWNWNVATANKNVDLENLRDKVMNFTRYGTNGAAPRFNVDGIMERADNLTKSIPGMEHHRGFDDYINHPDAIFIANSRTDIPALIEQHEKDQQQIATLKKALELACNRLSDDGLCPVTEELSESVCDNCNEDYCTNEVRTEEWSKYFIQQSQGGRNEM